MNDDKINWAEAFQVAAIVVLVTATALGVIWLMWYALLQYTG